MDMADMKPFGVISWQLYPACYGWKYDSTPSSQHWIHREAYIYVYSILVYANCYAFYSSLDYLHFLFASGKSFEDGKKLYTRCPHPPTAAKMAARLGHPVESGCFQLAYIVYIVLVSISEFMSVMS